MGTKGTDDMGLYKPSEGENGYAGKVNNGFDRVGRAATQIKLVSPDVLQLGGSVDVYVVTTRQLGGTVKWSLGASSLRDFTYTAVFTSPPERSDHYIYGFNLASGPSMEQVGGGDPVYASQAMALLAIWEEDPNAPGEWVIVASMPVAVQNIL